MKKGEKGFSVVEIIMAVVIVVLLGAVVYFYMQASQKNDKSNSKVTTSSASPSPTVSAAPVLSFDDYNVKTSVNIFYGKYWSAVVGVGEGSGIKAMDAAVSQYGTANFIAIYNGIEHGHDVVVADPVLCINGTLDSAPAVANVKLASGKATVTVNVAESITSTVVVVNDNGPKIDSISCSS